MYNFTTSWDRDAHNPFGLTATPIVFTNITIQGNGATLQWTGTGHSRLFAVGSASMFDTLDNKTVSGTGALRLEKAFAFLSQWRNLFTSVCNDWPRREEAREIGPRNFSELLKKGFCT